MVLGGLWHGAAWSYAVWGAFHGIALAIERLINDYFDIKIPKALLFFKGLFIFLMVTFAWLLFKLPEFNHVIAYVSSFFNNPNGNDYNIILHILLYSIPVILYHFFYLLKENKGNDYLKRAEPILYSTMLFLIITNSGSATDFIYFQF